MFLRGLTPEPTYLCPVFHAQIYSGKAPVLWAFMVCGKGDLQGSVNYDYRRSMVQADCISPSKQNRFACFFFVAFSFRGDGLITSWQIASSDKYNLFIGSGSSSTKVMIHPYGTRCHARENYQQVFRNNCGTDTSDA